jgi:hypothetical protein
LHLLGNTTKHVHIVMASILLYFATTITRALIRKEWRPKLMLAETVIFLRLMCCLMFALYFMLCFKWWSHLRGPLHDQYFWAIDQSWQGMKDAIFKLADWLDLPVDLYFRLFGMCFFLSYMVSIGTRPAIFMRMVTGTVGVALIGGLGYMIAPANGPFVIEPSSSPLIAQTQAYMLAATEAFHQSGGKAFAPEDFAAVLGAMPSLHVAHSVMLACFAYLLHPLFGLVIGLIAAYVTVYAVVTHFHYLIDLPFGLMLGLGAVWLTEKLYRWHQSKY